MDIRYEKGVGTLIFLPIVIQLCEGDYSNK